VSIRAPTSRRAPGCLWLTAATLAGCATDGSSYKGRIDAFQDGLSKGVEYHSLEAALRT